MNNCSQHDWDELFRSFIVGLWGTVSLDLSAETDDDALQFRVLRL